MKDFWNGFGFGKDYSLFVNGKDKNFNDMGEEICEMNKIYGKVEV